MTQDPLALFLDWYREWSREAARLGLQQSEAMLLATATLDGRPSLRTVLYRPGPDGGIRFFTNYEGRKARELEANPRAAVLFYWEPLHRQVRVEGRVARTSDHESDAYFAGRPRMSQLAAWASPQSRPIERLSDLDAEVAALDAKYAGGSVPRPPFWGGYRIDPDRWELWSAREHRLHERVLFVKSDAGWVRSLLGP